MNSWISIKNLLPPENQVVMTRGECGREQKLIRKGNLFFLPDWSMYVYYNVEYWKEIQ